MKFMINLYLVYSHFYSLPNLADIAGKFDMTQTYDDILPPRDQNCILLTVEQLIYPLNGTDILPTVQYNTSFKAVLDTGNSMLYPLMTVSVLEELKSIEVISSKQKLLDTHSTGTGISGALFTTKTLNLETQLTFLTEVGTKIHLRNFYVVDKMPEDINIGKYAMSQLGIRWDSKQDYVYLGKDKIPLRSNKYNV